MTEIAEILDNQRRIIAILLALTERVEFMSDQVTNLEAAQSATDTAIANAIGEIAQLTQQLTASQGDQAAIAQITADLNAKATALNAAVSGAQTPAQPAQPAPQPAPQPAQPAQPAQPTPQPAQQPPTQPAAGI